MPDFSGKSVVITGGATGIGRAAAIAFAKAGAKVMIGDTNDRAAETVDVIAAQNGTAQWRLTDVADDAAVKALIGAAVEEHGGLDIAFNNAGYFMPQCPLHEMSLETFDTVMAVNGRGVFSAMKAQIPHMLAAGGGSIVNTASIGGMISHPGMAPYVASKHAVVGLTRSASIDYAQHNIRVNAICPGFVRTAMTEHWSQDKAFMDVFPYFAPSNRFAEPEEIAGMVLHLCSDAASFTSGAIIPIDGAQTAM